MEDAILVAKALRIYADVTDDEKEASRCLELARSLEASVIGAILDES